MIAPVRLRHVPRRSTGVALLALWACLACMSCLRRPVPLAPPRPDVVRVMSYNVEYKNRDPTETILQSRADIVALQEVTPWHHDIIEERLATRYAHRRYHLATDGSGLAILSRFPLRSYTLVSASPSPLMAGRAIVETPAGPLQVLNLHLTSPSMGGNVFLGFMVTPPQRLAEVQAFLPQLVPGLPTILLGDLNEVDGAPSALIRAQGYTDAIVLFSDDARTWKGFSHVGPKVALDHLFLSSDLAATQAQVWHRGNSDHWPIWADVILR